jgi:hypothetical protein
VAVIVIVGGNIDQFTFSALHSIRAKVASELGLPTQFVVVSVAAGSVRLTLRIGYESADEAASGRSWLTQKVGTTADASAFLSTAELECRVASVELAPALIDAGTDPYAERARGGVMGGIVGAITVVSLGGVLLFLSHKAKASAAEASAKAEAEAATVRMSCEAEVAKAECSFWWVNAKALRESKDVTLPKFQDLRKREGFLIKKKITRRNSVQGAYTVKYLTISHRWLGGYDQPPDPTGTQLDAVRKYLLAHLDIEWVWFEYVSRCVIKPFPP